MTRQPCGWLWLHDHPAFLRDRGRVHGCARPPRHRGLHHCWCGETIR